MMEIFGAQWDGTAHLQQIRKPFSAVFTLEDPLMKLLSPLSGMLL